MKNEQISYLVGGARSSVPLGKNSATFYRLAGNVSGIMYEPAEPDEKAQTAILVMHSDADYLTFTMGSEMAGRGYRVLCANVSDKQNSLDRKIRDVGGAVSFLRAYPGVKKVILMGHSGGGTLMSAYQCLAENGTKIFQGSEKIMKCSDELADLPPADGIMLLDSNWGNGAMALFSLDPAVTDEEDAQVLDPRLNLFNPANGFDPSGSDFSKEFTENFFKGQRKRQNRLIEAALERLEAIETGIGIYADDEPFTIPGMEQGFLNNKLYAQDIRLMSHTRAVWPLLHADGSVTSQVVHSVRQAQNKISQTGSFYKGALQTTVRNFLNSYAVRTTVDYGYDEDTLRGIDWSSSYNCLPGNIQGITIPLLVMGMTAGWEFMASETIYENAGSTDKTLIFVEGATHLFNTAKDCEEYPGQYGDTQKTTYDYVDKWLSQEGRFCKY